MPALGAATAGAGVLVLGYMANRYLSDVIPLLVITASLGVAVVARWAAGRPRRTRVAVLVVATVLALWGAWVNTSLGLQYQREIAPGAPGDARQSWLVWQARLGPDPAFVRIGVDEPLPPAEQVGTVVVVGDCDGVYRSTGGDWQPIEGGPGVGRFDLEGAQDEPLEGTVPLLAGAGPAGRAGLDLEVRDGRATPVVWSEVGGDEVRRRGDGSFPVTHPGWHLRVMLDWRIGYAEVRDPDEGETLLAFGIDLPRTRQELADGGSSVVTASSRYPKACEAISAG
jgi:hypothetical protein